MRSFTRGLTNSLTRNLLRRFIRSLMRTAKPSESGLAFEHNACDESAHRWSLYKGLSS